MRVSDLRRAFQATFRVTGISDYWNSSTMGVLIIRLRSPGSTGNKPGSSSNQPVSTLNHCTAVWQKQHLWESIRCTWKS